MNTSNRVSPEIYELLQQRAREAQSTSDAIAETALRLQLGNTIHIEQRLSPEQYTQLTRRAA